MPAFSGTVPTDPNDFVASGVDVQEIASGQTAAPNANPPYEQVSPANPYAGLLGLLWRGFGIPYTEMRLSLRQDLAIHKFTDRDGAHVESTGRHPLQIEARCPFINTIAKGMNESWAQPLYPTQWRTVLDACADNTSDTLVHPELGPITCKVETMVTVWSAHARGGPESVITWIETDDSAVDTASQYYIGQPSPISALSDAATSLDANLTLDTWPFPIASQPWPAGAFVPEGPPDLPVLGFTFASLASALQSVGTQSLLLQKQNGGRTSNVIYQASQLEAALGKKSNAINWPLVQAAEQAKAAAYDLQASLLTSGKSISLGTVQKDSTLAQVACDLQADLSDLITLNVPLLLAGPVVPKGSIVRFYKLAA